MEESRLTVVRTKTGINQGYWIKEMSLLELRQRSEENRQKAAEAEEAVVAVVDLQAAVTPIAEAEVNFNKKLAKLTNLDWSENQNLAKSI